MDAYDVKFSLLNLRDYAGIAGIWLHRLNDVQIVDSTHLDIIFSGNVEAEGILPRIPIIPRHLWELSGDLSYGDVGHVDPAKLDPTYDPLTHGTLIGSGPFMCRSLFTEDLGRVGTGCARSFDGNRAGQSLGGGATILLSAFDRTSEPGNTDPYLQYHRTYNSAWGTGSGTADQSGQYQEFVYADGPDKDAQVTVADLQRLESCLGVGQSGTTACPAATYNYYHRKALDSNICDAGQTSPCISSLEIAIVVSHFDDIWVYPDNLLGLSWSCTGPNLENIVPYC